MASKNPTPDELIAQLGLQDAEDIDRRLMEICDEELHAEPPRPQDLRLAFNCLRAILMRHWENPDPTVQKHVAGALMRRAQILSHTGRIDEAHWDFEEVWKRYGHSDDLAVRKAVAAAVLEAGNHEERQENYTAAEKWYELSDRFQDDADPMTQYQVVQAQCNICSIHFNRGWLDTAIQKAEQLERQWSDHPEYWIRRRIANLMLDKAGALKEDEDRCEEALAAFDQVIAYAKKAVNPPLLLLPSSAQMAKSNCLERMERYEEAIACVNAMEQWFQTEVLSSSDYQPELDDSPATSLRTAYEVKGRCLHALGRYQEALEAFEKGGTTYDDIVENMQKRASACHRLASRAFTLVGLGRYDEAERMHNAIIKQTTSFGEPYWTAEMMMELAFLNHCIQEKTLDLGFPTTPTAGSPGPS